MTNETVNINSISKDDLPWIIEYDSEKCMLSGYFFLCEDGFFCNFDVK